MDDEIQARAQQRREQAERWPVRRYLLGEEPALDPLDASTAEERLAMMWPLAVEMWAVSGKPIPNYSRAQSPGRILRNGDSSR